ncbi:uncharacterized protein LOC34624026 [Cyclospora cayetanensis]|uniref:Uncharacterized protein LOC34624026 n=1 Tax=Cyclospora cayetanensis TaxID=88456 RepID=A0A6P6RU96_9EIME|nr:uncharacterized protein LOC34624026 [Cyclospora cayetanensis]
MCLLFRHRVKLLLSEQEKEIPNLFSNLQKGEGALCQEPLCGKEAEESASVAVPSLLGEGLHACAAATPSPDAVMGAAALEDEAAVLAVTACGSGVCSHCRRGHSKTLLRSQGQPRLKHRRRPTPMLRMQQKSSRDTYIVHI